MASTRSRMWMGPRDYERWVPAPKVSSDFSAIGTREKDQYLNGGAGIRGTKDGHKEYNLSWTSKRREELAPVLDVAKGIYDTGLGNDLVYFVDPTVYDWNILPDMLASPYKTGLDGVPLTVDAQGYLAYPDVQVGEPNAFGYPVRAATYTLGAGIVPGRPLYVPIPPGKTFWIGVHGSASGAGVVVTPYNGQSALQPVIPDMLDVNTSQRVNTSWSRADGASGVEINLGLTGPSTGSVTLQGIIGQMLDDGVTPFPGDFISGEGNSGCEFDAIPTLIPYRGGKVWAMTARAIETGAWQ